MGIKDFYKNVKARWPDCFVPATYESFRFQRIAIDMMNVLYTLRARNERDWMGQLVQFLLKLRDARVHPVCVFDGPNTHPLKQSTVNKRREEREKGKRRVSAVEMGLNLFLETQKCTPEFQVFLDAHPNCVSMLTQQPVVSAVQEYLERTARSYNLAFQEHEIDAARVLISAMGICVLTAEFDGEALCAYLSANGTVDAVLSNDSDVFFFGAKRVLFRFADEGAYLIETDQLFQSMEITREQFINLCLLCGTDFNESVRGVGFVRAYNLVKQYTDLLDPNFPLQLDHKLLELVRQFTNPQQEALPQPHYTRPGSIVDVTAVGRLFFRFHVTIPLESVLEAPRTAIVLGE